MSFYIENINESDIPASVILATLFTPIVAAVIGLAAVAAFVN